MAYPGAAAVPARRADSRPMFRKAEIEIQTGDRLVELNRERTEWIVDFVFSDPNQVPHARLRRKDDATIQRTFACAVLQNDARFKRLAGQAA